MNLYNDSGTRAANGLGSKAVATTTTNSRGVYRFENVLENSTGRYHTDADSTAEYAAYNFAGPTVNTYPCGGAQGVRTYCTWGKSWFLGPADAREANRTFSDAQGQQPGLPWWTYTINSSPIWPGQTRGAGGLDPDFVLLFKTGKVSGRVVNDPATGADKPMANVDLWLDHCRRPANVGNPSRTCTPGMFSPRQTATTDSLGNYEFTSLIEGLYRLQVALPNNFGIVSGTTAQSTWHEVRVPQQVLSVNYNLRRP